MDTAYEYIEVIGRRSCSYRTDFLLNRIICIENWAITSCSLLKNKCEIRKVEDGKKLLMLQIPASAETPYYYTGDGVTEAYIRIGNENVVADATELKRLVMRGKNFSYNSLISLYNYDDFSFSKLRERYKA